MKIKARPISSVRRPGLKVTPATLSTIPLDDAEAAAMFLLEHMPPTLRADLGRLLLASAAVR